MGTRKFGGHAATSVLHLCLLHMTILYDRLVAMYGVIMEE